MTHMSLWKSKICDDHTHILRASVAFVAMAEVIAEKNRTAAGDVVVLVP